MAVIDHRFAPQAGAQRGEHRVGQHGVDVHRVGVALPAFGHGDAGLLQHGFLVIKRLAHAAASHQFQRTIVQMHAHDRYLHSPSSCWNKSVRPRLYSAMEKGLHSRMMAVYSFQLISVVPARKQR